MNAADSNSYFFREEDTLTSCFARNSNPVSKGITFISDNKDDEYITYRELYNSAFRALYCLQDKGVKEKDEVILQIRDNKSFLIVFWACLLGKIIPVPLSVGEEEEHRFKVFNICGKLTNPFLVTDAGNAVKLGTFYRERFATEELPALLGNYIDVTDALAGQDIGAAAVVSPQDVAYIQFSSGSTGQPKGVVLTHRNLLVNTGDIINSSGTGLDDSMISWMPLTHDMGLIGVHLTGLLRNIHQYLMPPGLFIRRPFLWLEKAAYYRATQLYAPNFGYQYLLSSMPDIPDATNLDLSPIRIIYNGAEMIDPDLCEMFIRSLSPFGLHAGTIRPVYGLAEASVAVTISPVGEAVKTFFLDKELLKPGDKVKEVPVSAGGIGLVDVGRPIPGCNVRISNDGEMLPEDTIGQIEISGANVTSGYYNDAAQSSDLFTADSWLKTGDLGFIRNGRLVVAGRMKNVIIINGQNYYPRDIERILGQVAGVPANGVAACGISTRDAGTDELIVFLVHKNIKSGFLPLLTALRQQLLTRMGIGIRKIIPVRKIPRTTSGKVQYHKLLEQYQSGLYNNEEAAVNELSRNDIPGEKKENQLIEIYLQLFGTLINEDDRFTDHGLSSLNAFKYAAKINEILCTNIQLPDIFNYPTAAALAAYIDAGAAITGELQPDKAIKPTVTQDSYDLSYAQQRIWLLSCMEKNRAAYNIVLSYTIFGEVDFQLLEKAFRKVIQRYEILRTGFNLVNGVPKQQIDNSIAQFRLLSADLRGHTNVQQELDAQIKYHANLLFDLSVAPLMRVNVFKTGDNAYSLLLVIHHIIADGWSLNILMDEVSVLYGAYRIGKVPKLPVVGLQYRDYVYWQQALMQSPAMAAQKNYWLNQLKRDIPVIKWPFEKTWKGQMGAGSGSFVYAFHDQTFKGLKLLSREHETTLFTTLVTLCYLLISKYTGSNEVIIGIDTAGRTTSQLERQIGYFLNTLCLKMDFIKGCRFDQLLNLTKQKILSALSHQEYPFEHLLDELRTAQGRNNDVFNVLIVFQNFEKNFRFNLGEELLITHTRKDNDDILADLHIEFIESTDDLCAFVKYNTTVFTKEDMERCMHSLEWLSEQAIRSPQQIAEDYDLLTVADRYRVLEEFNNTGITGQPDTVTNVLTLFDKAAQQGSARIAIISEDQHLSFASLYDLSIRLAFLLSNSYGIKKGDRVGVMLQRSEFPVVAILSLLRTGAVYIPLESDMPSGRLQYIIADSGINIILADTALADVPGSLQVLPLSMLINEADIRGIPAVSIDLQDLAYIMYTSGTTGVPKGVMIDHGAIGEYVAAFIQYFGISVQDRVVQQAALSFDTSLEEIFPVLCASGTLVIAKDGGGNVERLSLILEKEYISVLSTVPAVINELQQFADRMPLLEMIISGGDKLQPSHIEKLAGRCRIFNTYGPTETTVCASYHEVTTITAAPIIGKPVTGKKVYILNEALELLPPGAIGEICISGKGVARGYLNNPVLTQEKFVVNPFESNTRLYRTGDLGKWNADGSLTYCGRQDNQIKINGIRMEPTEIENILMRMPGVQEAVVAVHTQNEENTGFLIAYICTDISFSEESIKSWLRKYLPEYMVPRRYHFLSSFPLTASGKTDYNALVNGFVVFAGQEEPAYMPAGSAVQHQMVAVWKDVLSKESIGIRHNFYEAGGDSLKALQIVARLNDAGLPVTIRQMLDLQTIEQLSLQIEEAMKAIDIAHRHPDGDNRVLLPANFSCLWGKRNVNRYYNALLVNINLPVDIPLLVESFKKVLTCHAAFRLKYDAVNHHLFFDDKKAEEHFEIPIYHISGSDTPVQDIIAREVLPALTAQLALENAVNLKVALIKCSSGEAQLLMLSHGISMDGFSWGILSEHLGQVYEAQDNCKRTVNFPVSKWTSGNRPLYQLVPANDNARKTYVLARKTPGAGLHISVNMSVADTSRLLDEATTIYHTEPLVLLLTAIARTWQIIEGSERTIIEIADHTRNSIPTSFSDSIGDFSRLYPLEIFSAENIAEQVTVIKDALRSPQNSTSVSTDAGADIAFSYWGHLERSINNRLFTCHTRYSSCVSSCPVMVEADVVQNALVITIYWDDLLFKPEDILPFSNALAVTLDAILKEAGGDTVYLTTSDFDTLEMDKDDLALLFE